MARLAQSPDRPNPEASTRQRSEWLHQLADHLFIPLPRHFELHSLVSSLILQGYEKRRPANKQYVSMLQKAYSGQQHGSKEKVDYGGTISADPMSIALIGVSGVGKSFTLNRMLSTMYPQVLHHNAPEMGAVFDQVVYLKAEVPPNGSVKSMCASLINELGKVTGNGYAQTISKNITLEQMRIRVESLFNAHCVGLVVLDEVQNLLSSRSRKEELFNFIVEFSNTIHVPIVFVGTPKILEIREMGMRVSRRLGSMGCLQWDRLRPGSRDWKTFIRELWKYNILPEEELDIPEEIEQKLYDLSQGIPDLLLKLFILAQVRTLATAPMLKENRKPLRLYEETVEAVYDDYFVNVKPMIDILRSGDKERIARIEDLALDCELFNGAMTEEDARIREMLDSGESAEESPAQMLMTMAEHLLTTMEKDITPGIRVALEKHLSEHDETSISELIKIALTYEEQAGVRDSVKKIGKRVRDTGRKEEGGDTGKGAEKQEQRKTTSDDVPGVDQLD